MYQKGICQKSFFDDPERFADLMNGAYFKGEEILLAQDICPDDSVKLYEEIRSVHKRMHDVIIKKTKDGSMYMLYLLQNQVSVDYNMLIRVLMEEYLVYQKQVIEIRKRNKLKFGAVLAAEEFLYGFRRKDIIFPVYVLLLYWDAGMQSEEGNVQDVTVVPLSDGQLEIQLKRAIPNYYIHVYNLNLLRDSGLFKTSLRTVFGVYAYRQSGKAMINYMEAHKNEIQSLDEESRFLLATMLDDKRMLNKLYEKKEEGKEITVCEAIDELIQEGNRQGIRRGRLEGLNRGRAEAILVVLEETGAISDQLKEKIVKQKSKEILNRWLKLAARVKTVEDFERAIAT